MLERISKHKYSISIIVFAVWMSFFDRNSAVFMYKQYNELKDLKQQEEFISAEIVEMKQQKVELFSDDEMLERYARENFYFKRDNEDVYVFEED